MRISGERIPFRDIRRSARQLWVLVLLLLAVMTGAVFYYYFIESRRGGIDWSLVDCAYMAVITYRRTLDDLNKMFSTRPQKNKERCSREMKKQPARIDDISEVAAHYNQEFDFDLADTLDRAICSIEGDARRFAEYIIEQRIKGKTMRQIGEDVGISESYVSYILTRIRARVERDCA